MAESKKQQLVVKAASAYVRDPEGRLSLLYQGGTVGDGFDQDDVKRLTDEGFIGPEDDDKKSK